MLLTFGFQIITHRFFYLFVSHFIPRCIIIHTHYLLFGFYHNVILYLVNYTHATVFPNVNATHSNLSVSKYTHVLYFSVPISHYAFGFFWQSWCWESYFWLSHPSSPDVRGESGWLIPSPTKNSPANITHLVAS